MQGNTLNRALESQFCEESGKSRGLDAKVCSGNVCDAASQFVRLGVVVTMSGDLLRIAVFSQGDL